MVWVDGFIRLAALSAKHRVVVSGFAVELVNIFKRLRETWTGKAVGDAKLTDIFRHFVDEGDGFKPVMYAFGLDIKIIARYRVMVRFKNPHNQCFNNPA